MNQANVLSKKPNAVYRCFSGSICRSTHACRAAILSIVCDAVANFAEASELLDFDVIPIEGPISLVALIRRLYIKVSQSSHSKAVQRSDSCGESIREQSANLTQVEPLTS